MAESLFTAQFLDRHVANSLLQNADDLPVGESIRFQVV